MEDLISNRIEGLIREMGINANKFANLIGHDRATNVYNVLHGKTKPGFAMLRDIAENIPQVNAQWLLTGSGNMFTNTTSEKELQLFPIVVDPENNEWINFVPVYAQAGYLRGFADPEYIEELPAVGISQDGTLRDFEIKGDSMEPHILEGDSVRAKFLDPSLWQNQSVHLGELFIVVHRDDGIVLKQIIAHEVEKGIMTLHSFNNYYPDYTVSVEDIQQLWYYKSYTSRRKFL